MSASKKNKKSTTKFKKPETSSIISIIAIVEVIILVAVSTYAWYYFSVDNSLTSGIITVKADSGLEIDFKDADDKTSYIDIWKYLDRDNFQLEPATSVDGRNIYFPTSGTFGNTDTEQMTFREGTVNDINSKYISIDFELSNKSDEAMQVYLSDKSEFTITENGKVVNGKALRLAFYNNDGNSGYIAPSMIDTITETGTGAENIEADPDDFTIYYYIPQKYYQPKIYITDSSENDSDYAIYTNVDDPTDTRELTGEDLEAMNSGALSSMPGIEMSYVSGDVYSYTFNNPHKSFTVEENGETKKYVSTERMYDTVRFNNGYANWQTANFKISTEYDSDGKYKTHIYHRAMAEGSEGDEISFQTVYFLKPSNWEGTPRCIPHKSQDQNDETAYYDHLDLGNNKVMNEVTTGIYSFTFPEMYDEISFIDSKDNYHNSKTAAAQAGMLYYFPDPDETGISNDGQIRTVTYSESMIFFYNTLGWETPYAFPNAFPAADNYTYAIPMITLSGNLYYCKLPSVFVNDIISKDTTSIEGSTDPDHNSVDDFAANCTVFFGNEEKNRTEETEKELCKNTFVYNPAHTYTTENSKKVYGIASSQKFEGGDKDSSYAVISPGVSRGFQRSANPVKDINTVTGEQTAIVPAFASSFDDYIMGSNNPVFTIGINQTVHMSMILWLEGTDTHCTGENYAGKDIKLYLEFATIHAGDKIEGSYTYYFIDETEQHWTGNTKKNAAGIEIEPVMQLYDEKIDRGYKMEPASPISYAGENKVGVWKCVAPMTLAEPGHKLQFRRVNPYDETTVWNRWEAGELNQYLSVALKISTGSVYFTAFADGSPEYAVYDKGNDVKFDVPELSCGGLWGKHDTEILTVYDGRQSQSRTLMNDNGMLSLRYTYTYPGTEITADIEYASSNYRDLHKSTETYFDSFYSFVVPTDIYTQASNPQFKNYKHTLPNNTAINSDLNKNITLANIWFAGNTVDGSFFELNEEGSNAPDNANHTASSGHNIYHSYWGSDVIYIQTREPLMKDYDGGFKRVHFRTSNGQEKFYSYLYRNDKYNVDHGANEDTYGYVAVVPSDALGVTREFTNYRIEKVNPSDPDEIYETTGDIPLYRLSDVLFTGYATGDTSGGAYKSQSLISLDYYLWKIWFCNDTGNVNFNGSRVHHQENISTSDSYGRDGYTDLTLDETASVDGKKYYYASIPQVGNFWFEVSSSKTSDEWRNIDAKNKDGACYKPTSTELTNNIFHITETSKRSGIDRSSGEQSIFYQQMTIYSGATFKDDNGTPKDNSIQYWPRYLPKLMDDEEAGS